MTPPLGARVIPPAAGWTSQHWGTPQGRRLPAVSSPALDELFPLQTPHQYWSRSGSGSLLEPCLNHMQVREAVHIHMYMRLCADMYARTLARTQEAATRQGKYCRRSERTMVSSKYKTVVPDHSQSKGQTVQSVEATAIVFRWRFMLKTLLMTIGPQFSRMFAASSSGGLIFDIKQRDSQSFYCNVTSQSLKEHSQCRTVIAVTVLSQQ